MYEYLHHGLRFLSENDRPAEVFSLQYPSVLKSLRGQSDFDEDSFAARHNQEADHPHVF